MAQLNKGIVSIPVGGGVYRLTNNGPITAPGQLVFSIPQRGVGRDFSAIFQAIGTVSSLTCSLQADLSGLGTNFVDYVVSSAMPSGTAPKVVAASGSTPLIAGVLYQVNISVASGSFDLWIDTN
jgi:hypothetical protein